MKVSELIDSASILLHDKTNVKWPRAELLSWLNQAQLQIVMLRPDSSVQNANITLIAGTKQSIPAGGLRLLDILRNDAGKAIRLVSREVLDSISDDWHMQTPTAAIKHYTIDQRDPTRFYVYPPAIAASKIEGIYSIPPTVCVAETDNIFSDIYASPILDWMMYRAYSKDAEFASEPTKALAYKSSFMETLGAKTQTDLSFDPSKSQPNQINPNIR